MQGLMIIELLSCRIKAGTPFQHLTRDNESRGEMGGGVEESRVTPEHVGVCCLAQSSWHLPVYHPIQISGFPGPPPAERALPLLDSVCGLSRLAYLNCMHLTAVACLSGCFISAAHLKTLSLPLPSIHSLITLYKFQWLWCLMHRCSLEGPV